MKYSKINTSSYQLDRLNSPYFVSTSKLYLYYTLYLKFEFSVVNEF